MKSCMYTAIYKGKATLEYLVSQDSSAVLILFTSIAYLYNRTHVDCNNISIN